MTATRSDAFITALALDRIAPTRANLLGQSGFGLDLNNRRALASIMEADARRRF
jgi:hypothetical protein